MLCPDSALKWSSLLKQNEALNAQQPFGGRLTHGTITFGGRRNPMRRPWNSIWRGFCERALRADQRRLAGLPGTMILMDTKTRLKLRLVVNPHTGITVSRAGKTETALVEGLFDPFIGAPPTFELRGAWRKPLLKRRLEQLFQPGLTPWQTAAENFYTASSLLDPNEFTVESYSEDTDTRHRLGSGLGTGPHPGQRSNPQPSL